jgi:A/G-specific adenine glycosylase
VDFTTSIQRWYRQNKRELPWRETSDPYLIWLSEVILQQTRIEQGLPYFLKFKQKYPTVKDLASAPEDEVLNLWQGLGYYSRARNLMAGARYIVDFHYEKFPGSYDEILKIKGVGAYTASAVASIAFKQPHAVVDGNVYRVLSRVFKIDEPIDSSAGKKIIAATAQEILDKNNPGDHNQALMEIGSLICTPKSPDCVHCPVQFKCLSYADGTFLNYPVKEKKTKVRDRFFHYLVVTDGKKTILKKRPPKDIWQGLYDFPLVEKESAKAAIKADIAVLKPQQVVKEATFVHILSHQKIHATFWKVTVNKLKPAKGEVLVDWQDLDDFPMPQLLIRYLEQTRG